jgi:EF-P beta-lysylation protein EpmB
MSTKTPSLPLNDDSVRARCVDRSPLAPEPARSWRTALKDAVRDAAELCRILNIPNDLSADRRAAAASFPVFAPREFIARMTPGDPHDPLLRQVLAAAQEQQEVPGFNHDPVGDAAASLLPGLVRKYQSRALLITTGACAIHCRYCFRRHFPYEVAPRSVDDWQPALDCLANDPNIDEVILSGGDPLTIIDDTLSELAARIARIPHIQRLRIHTRLPIVIPQRVTGELLAWLRGTRLTTLVVVHANHANEIDHATAQALGRLVDAGVPVLNQAVLLRGVNDQLSALVELSRKLVNLRVTPYYLHQLDRVRGAAHFEVPAARGTELIDEMRKQLPGYAVPRYVQEVAGDTSKRVLN